MAKIVSLTATQAGKRLDALVDLLRDAVDSGASIGFLPPLEPAEAREYWRGVFDAVRSRRRIVLSAIEGKLLQGSVQLDLETRANGSHRAEAIKLFVHRRARRRGLARALMMELERVARRWRRTLLMDTVRAAKPRRCAPRWDTAAVAKCPITPAAETASWTRRCSSIGNWTDRPRRPLQ
jgi:GNAT superfamily N-acetyltransferase